MAIAFAEPRDAADGAKDGVFDLAAGFGLAAEGPVTWTVCGGEVELRSGRRSHAFGHETILAVEILSGLACAMVEGLRERPCTGAAEAVAAWEAAFAATDVLPWAAEYLGAEEEPTEAEWLAEEMRKARFSCRRLGVDLDRYIRASV